MSEETKPLEGYSIPAGFDPFEDYVGPMGYKEENGVYTCGFVIEKKHTNGMGALHGGMALTFADYSLFMIARDRKNGPCVTVSCTADFCTPAKVGDLVEATGEVVHETRKMLFIQGRLSVGATVILRFSGILKKVSMPGSREKDTSASP